MSDFWIHPALILLLGAALLPLVPERARKGWLLLVPVLVFGRTLFLTQGVFGEVRFLDWTLTFGRVDKLSLVFGYIMSLMAVIGTLYGLHVKRVAEHIAAWVYVGGSLGAIYAGDLLTLFVFWELMALSSVFLIWFRGRKESLGAGTAICWCIWREGWRCLPASCCISRKPEASRLSPSTWSSPRRLPGW